MPSASTGKLLIEVIILRKKIRLLFEKEKFDVAPTTYADLFLYPGKILTQLEYNKLKSASQILKYENAAYQLLAKGKYSRHDLSEKLYKRGARKWMVEEIIAQLIKQQLIDDKQYTQERVELGHHRDEGYYKIINDLKNKGISKTLLDSIEFNERNEIQKATNHLEKLNNRHHKKSFLARKQAIIKSIIERGFSYDIAAQAINNFRHDNLYDEQENLKQEYQTAFRKYQNRFQGSDLTNRVYKYLLQKGYRHVDINKIIKGDLNDEMD